MEPFAQDFPVVEEIPVSQEQWVRASRFHNQWQVLVVCLMACDSLMLFLASRLSYYIRFEASFSIFHLDVAPSELAYHYLSLGLIPVWLGGFALAGLYNRQNLLRGTREASLILNASTMVLFLILASEFFIPGWDLARGWLLVMWVGVVFLILLGRFSIRRGVRRLRKKGLFLSNAVIVGANSEGWLLANQLTHQEFSGLRILGFVDDRLPPATPVLKQYRILGPIDTLDDWVKQYQVEEIILASSAVPQDQFVSIFQKYGVSRGINLRMSSGLYQMIATGFEVADFANVPLIGIKKIRLTGLDSALKWIVDYSIALPVAILLSPLYVLIALLVKFSSPGPVIYRRRVMGINGRQFDAFKFRTMVDGADKLLQNQPDLEREFKKNHKLKEDPRVTRVGAYLRKASLDELPQIFNVLRGEMSLVGPRMICPEEMVKYRQAGVNLLTVKPGITGLWQVNGRSNVSYEERVEMDMFYIRNWSLLLDLHLLLRTIPAILSRKGAY